MKAIKKTYHIKAPLERVWECLVDPREIENWGGGPAEMDSEEGSHFKFWGGEIFGTNIEVVPNEKLVQEWYGGEWDEPSLVTITLSEDEDASRIDLLQDNVPPDERDSVDEGWDEYFFGAMKKYLEHS